MTITLDALLRRRRPAVTWEQRYRYELEQNGILVTELTRLHATADELREELEALRRRVRELEVDEVPL